MKVHKKAAAGIRGGFLSASKALSPLTGKNNQHTMKHMVTESIPPDHGNDGRAASLSRTMPIALEEATQTGAEMTLSIRGGNNRPPRNLPLERKTYLIGRQEEADIQITTPSASRQHARIFFLHNEEIIEDLNSTNGTFVNGVRVSRCVLQDNDIIRIGDATMLFSRSASPKDSDHDA